MELEKLIPQYYEHKQELNEIDKTCKAENADIKRLMEEDECTKFIMPSEDGLSVFTANYIVKKHETMNEDMLLELLKSKGLNNLIVTKECVDMDALESAMYHNEIDTEIIMEMDKCKQVKETIELRVTKKGGKRNEGK